MWYRVPPLFLGTVLYVSHFASGLGSSCTVSLGGGAAAPGEPYWLESIQHRGKSPFNPHPHAYEVFRNVKDYGAVGDGVTDDTAAIMAAMSFGGRCGAGCASSTISPAIVYLPRGAYRVSSAIQAYYYTQIIGDARNPPTILASSNFSRSAVIDADPYIPDAWGAQWFSNQDNLYDFLLALSAILSVASLQFPLCPKLDHRFTAGPIWKEGDWFALASGSSDFVVVEMSTAPGTNHQGMFMENGSGGFMGDIVFNGGRIGIEVGNQQFTVRNLTVNNAVTAVLGLWNWGFTFQGVTINNCQIGFALTIGGSTLSRQGVGSEVIVDAVVSNTTIFVQSSVSSNGTLPYSLVLNNIQLTNVPTAVGIADGVTILEGGTTTIASWGQGNVYSGTGGQKTWTQGNIVSVRKPASLLTSAGKIFGKGHPQYASYAPHQIISIRSQGAKGDGKTDHTRAIQRVLDRYAGCKIIFFDAGVYYVTNTIAIPSGTRIVGEAWSVILAGGRNFQSHTNPRPVIRAGSVGSRGTMEISDLLLTTVGPAPGAIMIEWNVHEPVGQQGAAGLWDTHIRLGGAIGTNLQYAHCPSGSVNASCQAAFLGLHLTPKSSAYFEGTWVWTADHDLDALGQTSVFTGRGILSESAGPVGSLAPEHAALYQYNLVNARNHYIGFVQTETPYYQPVPPAPAPFDAHLAYHDPTFSSSVDAAWAFYIQSSSNIMIFGAGFYSFFQNYDQGCLASLSCQQQIFNIDSASAQAVTVYGLSTVGATYQLSVDNKGVVNASNDLDGFQETLTTWHG